VRSIAALVTGPNFKFVHNVAGLLPVNILKSKLRYSNPFLNGIVSIEGMVANLAPNLVAIAASLDGSEKGPDQSSTIKSLSSGETKS